MLKVGDSIPNVTVYQGTPDGPKPLETTALFANKTVILFGLPGAFTPTCSAQHVPSYMKNADALAAKGVEAIACLSVNDAFVMQAWGENQNVGDTILMLGDGDAAFTKAAGLELDLTGKGLGLRCQRFALVAKNGVVSVLHVEEGGGYDVSSAESILAAM